MKKHSTGQQSPRRGTKASRRAMTIGMDLGDKTSRYCVLNDEGAVVQEGSVATTKKAMQRAFGARKGCRMALEVGTHSSWVSRLLGGMGHEVIVAHARQVQVDQRQQPQG